MAARQTGQSSKNKSGSGEIGFSIGGNLSIISEQDTDDYASKQTQAGGTFVYGSGGTVNIGQQKVESHLRSVQEQSGIVAGDGGFDITVGGNTHLALLHGMAGAAMAALGGADALNGAVSAAGAEKAKIAISEFLENNKGSLSWEDYQSLMEIGSAMVGGALGGSTGANIAVFLWKRLRTLTRKYSPT
ncbi:hypothetical protein I5U15_22510, partial [Stenotrophomonas maltophilia]|nr:hypothetical protein [Stenotrophomonas maltophilia]HDS1608101.1 hypothetical protein [Stenotrophomonas maltophilia]